VDLCIDLWSAIKSKRSPSSVASIEVFKLAKTFKLCIAEVFDCNLAVTAKENSIDISYIENVDDFKCYPFVKTLTLLKNKVFVCVPYACLMPKMVYLKKFNNKKHFII
jgi:hypothetical protein